MLVEVIKIQQGIIIGLPKVLCVLLSMPSTNT